MVKNIDLEILTHIRIFILMKVTFLDGIHRSSLITKRQTNKGRQVFGYNKKSVITFGLGTKFKKIYVNIRNNTTSFAYLRILMNASLSFPPPPYARM